MLTDSDKYQVLKNSSLYIAAASRDRNDGRYTCHVDNGQGQTASGSAHFIIMCTSSRKTNLFVYSHKFTLTLYINIHNTSNTVTDFQKKIFVQGGLVFFIGFRKLRFMFPSPGNVFGCNSLLFCFNRMCFNIVMLNVRVI